MPNYSLIKRRLENKDWVDSGCQRQALEEGWDLFNAEGYYAIQKIDDPYDLSQQLGIQIPTLESDADADRLAWMAKRCNCAYGVVAVELAGSLVEDFSRFIKWPDEQIRANRLSSQKPRPKSPWEVQLEHPPEPRVTIEAEVEVPIKMRVRDRVPLSADVRTVQEAIADQVLNYLGSNTIPENSEYDPERVVTGPISITEDE